VVDGELRGSRWWCGERRLTASLASNSGCNRVLCDEEMLADPILHSDGDGGG
jgi:hypothetical protein